MSARWSDRLNGRLPAMTPPALRWEALGLDTLERLMQVEQQAYAHPWTRGNFQDALNAGYETRLLWQGEELLGYFVAMRGVDETHLLNITVAPAHQRQGWARRLLDQLADWSRAQGAEWLWLEVRVGNHRAIAVYEAYGFRRVGERKRYYPAANGQREDAIVMSLRL